MAEPVVSPGHDLSLAIDLEELNTTTGLRGPMLTGPVTARLVSAAVGAVPAEGAAAIDPALDVDCTHVGTGRWLEFFDGEDMTDALLQAAFSSGANVPWVVFQVTGGGRFPVQCRYERERILVPYP